LQNPSQINGDNLKNLKMWNQRNIYEQEKGISERQN
jgi:hypothetical protein